MRCSPIFTAPARPDQRRSPPQLLFHPGYVRAARGIEIPGRHRLFLHGCDVSRAADGSFRVNADWTQAPSGAGYALADRRVVANTVPDFYEQIGPRVPRRRSPRHCDCRWSTRPPEGRRGPRGGGAVAGQLPPRRPSTSLPRLLLGSRWSRTPTLVVRTAKALDAVAGNLEAG